MYPIDLTKTITPTTENKKRFLDDAELDKLALFLVGNQQRFRENIIIPRMVGPVAIKTNEEKRVERVMESCVFKSIMSCVLGNIFSYSFPHTLACESIKIVILIGGLLWFVGYGLGAAIGLFSSSVNPNMTNVENQSAREILREMKTTTLSYAKNFAVVGCIFSAVECAIESVIDINCCTLRIIFLMFTSIC